MLRPSAVAEVERDMLAGIGSVEDHVATFALGQRHMRSGVVLVAGVVRKFDADAGEGVDHQARAVEADLVVVAVAVGYAAVADALGGAVGPPPPHA